MHHSQVGGQSAVQAAADVLRWGHRVSGPNCSLAHWLPGDLLPATLTTHARPSGVGSLLWPFLSPPTSLAHEESQSSVGTLSL